MLGKVFHITAKRQETHT